MKKIGILLLISLVISCKKDIKTKKGNLVFEEIGKKQFILNKTSTINISSAEFFKDKQGQEIFSFLNVNDNSLVVYHDNQPKVISLAIEGVDGLGHIKPFYSSYKFISEDSILILQSHMGKMFLINSKGSIKNEYNLFDIKNIKNEYSYPKSNTIKPILYNDKKVFIGNGLVKYFKDYNKVNVVSKIDFLYKKNVGIGKLSNRYNQNFWGSLFKYDSYICLTNNSTLLVSFPIDENISEMDFSGNIINKYKCKSDYIDKVAFMNKNIVYGNDESDPNWDAINKFSLSNSDYYAILYNKYNDCYYRLAFIRPSSDSVKKGKTLPDFSVIIMNSKFQKIGEKRFDSSIYSNSLIMVCKEGLAIARKDLYRENDNQLTFSIFNIKNNNNENK